MLGTSSCVAKPLTVAGLTGRPRMGRQDNRRLAVERVGSIGAKTRDPFVATIGGEDHAGRTDWIFRRVGLIFTICGGSVAGVARRSQQADGWNEI
jgi:hypothetical protein